jgi:putative transposase
MQASMTAQLVTSALLMVVWRRGRVDALGRHSDQGYQYTSDPLQRLLAEHGVVCSMSRSGSCWDNAAMESFFSSLKTERVACKTYRTCDEARADVSAMSSASTIRAGVTRRSAPSAPWSSSGRPE